MANDEHVDRKREKESLRAEIPRLVNHLCVGLASEEWCLRLPPSLRVPAHHSFGYSIALCHLSTTIKIISKKNKCTVSFQSDHYPYNHTARFVLISSSKLLLIQCPEPYPPGICAWSITANLMLLPHSNYIKNLITALIAHVLVT